MLESKVDLSAWVSSIVGVRRMQRGILISSNANTIWMCIEVLTNMIMMEVVNVRRPGVFVLRFEVSGRMGVGGKVAGEGASSMVFEGIVNGYTGCDHKEETAIRD